MKPLQLLFFLFMSLVPVRSWSQTDSTLQSANADSIGKAADSTVKTKTTFSTGVDFYSNLHYFGRTDSLRSTAWVPNVLLQFGSGIFINSSLIFVNSAGQALKYTAATLGGGYKWGRPEKVKGWTGSVYAAKFFYSNSLLVQSSQEGQAGANVVYHNKIANINMGGSMAFGDQTDFFLNLGFDHLFKYKSKTGKSIYAIIPSLSFNAGTQKFTNTYYKSEIFPLTDTVVTETSKNFKVLSIELSVPVVFVHNKWAIIFTPGIVLPQSVIKVEGRPDLSENASTLGYANLGISYTFGRKK